MKQIFFYTLYLSFIVGDILRLSAVISKEEGEYVLANLKEAVELYLEDEKDIKLSDIAPFVTTFEVKACA